MNEIKEKNIIEFCRGQKGNKFYSLSLSVEDEDTVVACDAWEDEEAFNAHGAAPEIAGDYAAIVQKYIVDMNPIVLK